MLLRQKELRQRRKRAQERYKAKLKVQAAETTKPAAKPKASRAAKEQA